MTFARYATPFILLSAFAFVPAQAADNIALDQTMTVAGIETACTGVGLEARQDAKWRAYPMLIEFVGRDGQYLSDGTVTMSGNGHDLSVHCQGPWVLMKLPAGDYKIGVDVAEGGHKDLNAKAPASGQTRLTVRYPNAGGAETPNERVAAAQPQQPQQPQP